jgi:predicted alpha/beta hydrolase family esterase
MMARLLRALLALQLAAAVAWAVGFWRTGRPVLALAGAAAILLLHALFLAIEFGLMLATRRGDPVPPAPLAAVLRAFGQELLAAPRVFFWRQAFRATAEPDHLPQAPAHPGGRTGVLLVHGFVCNRGLWNPWLRRLRAQDRPFVAVNLEPVFGGIDDVTGCIEAGARRLEAATGRPPVVVAHSMGGLAVRRWLAGQDAARVQAVLTIATPHQGTWLARLAFSLNGRQMQPHSPWLRALAAREARRDEPHARFTVLHGDADNIVFPPRLALLPGAAHRLVPGVAHVHMAERPEAWAALQALLDRADATR